MPGQVGCLDPLVFLVTESMKKSAAAGWVSSIAATINTSTAKSPSSFSSPGHRRRTSPPPLPSRGPDSFQTRPSQHRDHLRFQHSGRTRLPGDGIHPGVTFNEKLADASSAGSVQKPFTSLPAVTRNLTRNPAVQKIHTRLTTFFNGPVSGFSGQVPHASRN